jgi:hypothetical protein
MNNRDLVKVYKALMSCHNPEHLLTWIEWAGRLMKKMPPLTDETMIMLSLMDRAHTKLGEFANAKMGDSERVGDVFVHEQGDYLQDANGWNYSWP